jgi:hypothetical protein
MISKFTGVRNSASTLASSSSFRKQQFCIPNLGEVGRDMSLVDRLRNAQHHSREAARQSVTRAWLSLEETQTMMRRKMRIYPRRARPRTGVVAGDEVETSRAREASLRIEPKEPIISVNGKDIDSEDIDKTAA